MSRSEDQKFASGVRKTALRKLKARRKVKPSVWLGLGMMGLIGWSVAIPTLLGAGLGVWLDQHFPDTHSWTLSLLVVGLTLGCMNAWHWIEKEDKAMRDEDDDEDEKEEKNHE